MSLRSAATSKGPVRYGMIEMMAYKRKQVTLTANRTLKSSDSGTLFLIGAADLVVTLPATAAGLVFEFQMVTAGLSAGTGLSISPAAADAIYGNGLTSVDNKDLILAGAGDRIGDMVQLVGDAGQGYAIARVIGTWTKEA